MTRKHQALSYRHFERKREIFVIRGQAVDVWKSQTRNLRSKTLSGIALFILRGASDFYAPHHSSFFILHSSFLIPHSSFEQSFHSQSMDGAAHGLILRIH